MLKAKKGKRTIRIPESMKKAYMGLGYTITDMKGTVVYDASKAKNESDPAKKEDASGAKD